MRIHPRAGAVLVAAALGSLLLWAQGCARPGNPRGGVPDRRPPVVIAAEPAPNALVVNPEAQIRFHFSERVSERPQRGTMDEAVLVSPATGAVHVQHGRDWIGVHIDGGLRPKVVYRVTLLPVISDLFGNTMRDPFDLVFSTGGRMVANAVAGQVLDRITGRPVPDLTVELLPRAPQPDTLLYVSRTDDRGLYFFRYVQPAVYDIVAFQDRNRDRKLEPTREPSGVRSILFPETADTVRADLTVLEPDTTAATLTRVEVMDSVTLRLVFSDYLDPELVSSIGVTFTAPEGKATPVKTRILHPTTYELLKDTAKARAAQAAAAGVALAVPGQELGGLPAGVPLPRQEAVVEVASPLEINVDYGISVAGVTNINHIPLGRGDTTFVRKPPPTPPARPPNAAGAGAAGSGGVAPPGAGGVTPVPPRTDSIAPPPVPRGDSVPPLPAPLPDTAAVRRDTVAALRGRR